MYPIQDLANSWHKKRTSRSKDISVILWTFFVVSGINMFSNANIARTTAIFVMSAMMLFGWRAMSKSTPSEFPVLKDDVPDDLLKIIAQDEKVEDVVKSEIAKRLEDEGKLTFRTLYDIDEKFTIVKPQSMSELPEDGELPKDSR